MAERDGITALKWCLFVGNMFLWLFGIGVLVFAMWLIFDSGNADAPEKLDQNIQNLSKDLGYYYGAVYILIGAGVILLFVGVIGWLGALRESVCMLTGYSIILGIIFLCHILSAALCYSYRLTIQQAISESIQEVVQEKYGDVSSYYRETQIIDYIQRRFNCCGGVEYEDWASSKWKDRPEYVIDEVVPASCCFGSGGLEVICPTYSAILGGKNPYLHQTGCGTKIKRRIADYIVGITAGGFSVGALELLAVVLSIVMVKKLQQEDNKIY
ncbi:hypothetical protein EB796_012243 [Bugula neritina]|uniref:Tetraspanin n=1 Tax=Bugula neritina TaxID=10212 RepID=A0A7J7JU35_BUGNE|nr:hypothetical protein EB796_012243 [Bugula neritina]